MVGSKVEQSVWIERRLAMGFLWFLAGVVASNIIAAFVPSTVKNGDTVWVVGLVKDPENNSWEFVGVFDDQHIARDHCGKNCFVGPVRLGVAFPGESKPWPGAYYPHFQEDPEDL